MGQGKRQGRGAGKRRRMMGFLQPCILVQLSIQDYHGYDLLKGLQDFVDDAENHDPSIVYRLMRDMEDNGYVRSYEGEVSYGPQRKMYSITEDGKAMMKRWVKDLQRTRGEIDKLLQHYAKNENAEK
jgi:PadR family transcriptional regulator PadR